MSRLLDARAWIRSEGAGGGSWRPAAAPTTCTLPACLSCWRIEEDFSLAKCAAPQSAVISNQAVAWPMVMTQWALTHLLINEWWSLQNRGQSWRINDWPQRLITRWSYSRVWPGSLHAWKRFCFTCRVRFLNNSASHMLIWGREVGGGIKTGSRVPTESHFESKRNVERALKTRARRLQLTEITALIWSPNQQQFPIKSLRIRTKPLPPHFIPASFLSFFLKMSTCCQPSRSAFPLVFECNKALSSLPL